MADLRDRKRQRAREKIVEAAFALFAERGFADVTVTEIAERAEVGRTTFFRYFGDKQEVVFADEQGLLEEMTEHQRSLGMISAQDVITALRQLRGTVLALCTAITKDEKHYVVHEQLLERTPELHDRSVRKLQRYTETIEGVLIDRGTPREVAVLAAQLALGCFHAGRRLAGFDPTQLVGEVDAAFERLVGKQRR
ncbi:TetR family transcriptional regulator [Allokutzneria sp. A3M-2-11 16]|uniref:TetR/AcrR family transcriptional regulator n=1 Tax=Allokutzneria sp. A3M-2-11 16 TaxID=2962043 RepID=UPI0020B7D0D2|nr:TetR family transcriptional regulator [Allokutzneria sp. A3M-2-11 16]MCP3803568.1 TetR family transcriptional regulator [Allokutzneria sp. A3M-2-11 16]